MVDGAWEGSLGVQEKAPRNWDARRLGMLGEPTVLAVSVLLGSSVEVGGLSFHVLG